MEVPQKYLRGLLEAPGAPRGAMRGASEVPQRCLTGAIERCLGGAFEVPSRCLRGVSEVFGALGGASEVL